MYVEGRLREGAWSDGTVIKGEFESKRAGDGGWGVAEYYSEKFKSSYLIVNVVSNIISS